MTRPVIFQLLKFDTPYLLEIDPPVEIWPAVEIWSHINYLLMEWNQTSFKYLALCVSHRGYKTYKIGLCYFNFLP